MKNILLLIALASCTTVANKAPEVVPAKPVTPVSVPTTPAKREIFYSKSSLPWVKELINKANCVVNSQDFLNEVKAWPKFTYSDATGEDVYKSILNLHKVNVETYQTKNPWSKAIATTYAGVNDTVFLNTRRNPRDMKYMINTVLHEPLHLVGYSHGDNSPAGKENSVNYRVGSIAEKYADSCN